MLISNRKNRMRGVPIGAIGTPPDLKISARNQRMGESRKGLPFEDITPTRLTTVLGEDSVTAFLLNVICIHPDQRTGWARVALFLPTYGPGRQLLTAAWLQHARGLPPAGSRLTNDAPPGQAACR